MTNGQATMARPQRRRLDHLVLPVSALDTARARLSLLGFTVADDADHPFGTENACVFFADKTYLEPLAVGQREDCEAAARAGNIFVARDQAYRFRRGSDGFSAIVVSSDDATADHDRFTAAGFSAGDPLQFSRAMRREDGTEAVASFRLAFASDLRAPDFFAFACQRIAALPADRDALERHANGVTGISAVVLSESNPTDFQYLLQEVVETRNVEAHSFGMDIDCENARLSVLNPDGMRGFLGVDTAGDERGLCARAIVLTVADLAATEHCLRTNGVPFEQRGGRLLVAPAPGQGFLLAFGE